MAKRRPPPNESTFPEYGPPAGDSDVPMLSADEAYARHEADQQAFDRVYLSLHRELELHAKFECAVKEDAEDVLQKVWDKVYQKNIIARFGGDLKRIAAYIRGAIHNQAIDDGVHERSLSDRADGYAQSPLRKVSEPEPQYQHALSRDIDRYLEKAIRKLPPRCRDVFIRRRYYGMTYDEIAEELGISPDTVATHMRTALERLRIELEAVGYYSRPKAKGEGKEHTP